MIEWPLVIVACVIASLAGGAVVALVVKRGPQGPPGEMGMPGPAGMNGRDGQFVAAPVRRADGMPQAVEGKMGPGIGMP